MNKIETRAVIMYLCKKNLSPQDIYQDTLEVLGDSSSSSSSIKLLRTGLEISNLVNTHQVLVRRKQPYERKYLFSP
jgi:hypothetical protein